MGLRTLYAELVSRKVLQVGAAYLLAAWAIVQVGATLLPTYEAPAWVMKTLVFVLAAGFPLALILTWILERAPDGSLRADMAASASTRRAGALALAAASMVFAALLWRGYGTVQAPLAPPKEPGAATTAPAPDPADPGFRNSIAVLPFMSLSADAEDAYFADGLADVLLNRLAALEGLKVIARNSSFQYKGQNVDVREVGKALGVANVLEGSVQRASGRLRVVAQLVDTRDGSHRWAQTYDRKLEDVFAVQDELATDLARQLLDQLTESDQQALAPRSTSDPEALALHLQGVQLMQATTVGKDELERVCGLMHAALRRDPLFVDAWTLLAACHATLAFRAYSERDLAESARQIALGLAASTRAVQLDPGNTSALLVNADLARRDGRAVDSLLMGTEALRRAPNDADALGTDGLTRIVLGLDLGQAERSLRRALDLDPLSASRHRQLAYAVTRQGRFEEAQVILDDAVERFPEFPILRTDRANLERTLHGDQVAALAVLGQGLADARSRAAMVEQIARLYLDLGAIEAFERWASRLAAIAPGNELGQARAWLASFAKGRAVEAHALASESPVRPAALVDAYTQLAMSAGQPKAAIEILLEGLPQVSLASTAPAYFQAVGEVDDVVLLAHALVQAGRVDTARRIAGDVQGDARLSQVPGEFACVRAAFAAVLDRREVANAALREHVMRFGPDGYRYCVGLRDRAGGLLPGWSAMADDPAFQALDADLSRRRDAQREAVLAAGEPDWPADVPDPLAAR